MRILSAEQGGLLVNLVWLLPSKPEPGWKLRYLHLGVQGSMPDVWQKTRCAKRAKNLLYISMAGPDNCFKSAH